MMRIAIFKNNQLLILLFWALFFNAKAQSVGGTTTGSTAFCAISGGGFISLSGQVGTIIGWESSTDSIVWNSTGNTNSTQGYNALTQTTFYRAIVQNGAFPPATSTVGKITIYPLSVGGNITGGGIFCDGNGILSLSGYVGTVQYWRYSIDGGATWTNVANTVATFNYFGVTENRVYQVAVQNSSYCAVALSATATVIISPSVAGSLTGGGVFCDSTGAGTIYLQNYIDSVVSWQSSTDGGTQWKTIAGETTNSLAYESTTQDIMYRTIVQLDACPPDTTVPVSFIVHHSVSGLIINNDTTVDYNDNEGTLTLINKVGTIIAWQYQHPFDTKDSSWTNFSIDTATTIGYDSLIQTTYFRVLVQYMENANSCRVDTSNIVKITVREKSMGIIPNLITPNGDGVNDTWFIKGLNNYDDNEIWVYNIYGNEVFNQKKYKNDWGGTFKGSQLPDGTYYYIIKLSDTNKLFKGSLDILKGK